MEAAQPRVRGLLRGAVHPAPGPEHVPERHGGRRRVRRGGDVRRSRGAVRRDRGGA